MFNWKLETFINFMLMYICYLMYFRGFSISTYDS